MVCPRPNGNRPFGPVHRLALEAGEVRGDLRELAGYVLGGVGVVAWARVFGHRPYTSAPTSTSTMLLVMRFQVASPTVKRVSPKYGPLSLTS
jgi:hypothetical protein